MKINNGDIFDIGQTVNGISEFLWFNNKWYYFDKTMSYEYQYDQKDLTKLITENEFGEIKFIWNIFKNNDNSNLKILYNEVINRIKFIEDSIDDFKYIKIYEYNLMIVRIGQLLIESIVNNPNIGISKNIENLKNK